MTYGYWRVTLFASAVLTLVPSAAYTQTAPSIDASVTTTQNQYCSSNSGWGLSIGYIGNFSAKCHYSSCPNSTWASSPATLSQPSTGICNFVPASLIAGVAGRNFASVAAVAQYLSWPNYGAPTFSYTLGMDGPNSRSWARAKDQTFVANTLVSVGVTIYIANLTFTLPIGQDGVITPDAYMSCAASGSSSQ